MTARVRIATTLASALSLLAACGRDNGLPRDLMAHLEARGISVRPARVYAPLSSRGGYLVMKHDAQVAAGIIAAFSLEKTGDDDPRWAVVSHSTGLTVTAKELWGVSGRPAQFKLKDGGQFEYFYLLVTPDGEMYLLAEYAYS